MKNVLLILSIVAITLQFTVAIHDENPMILVNSFQPAGRGDTILTNNAATPGLSVTPDSLVSPVVVGSVSAPSVSSCGCSDQPICACAGRLAPVRVEGDSVKPELKTDNRQEAVQSVNVPSTITISTPCGCVTLPVCGCRTATVATPSAPANDNVDPKKRGKDKKALTMKRVEYLKKQLLKALFRANQILEKYPSQKVQEMSKKINSLLLAVKKLHSREQKHEIQIEQAGPNPNQQSLSSDLEAENNLFSAIQKLYNQTADIINKAPAQPPAVAALKVFQTIFEARKLVNSNVKKVIKQRANQSVEPPSNINHRLRVFSDILKIMTSSFDYNLQKLSKVKDSKVTGILVELKDTNQELATQLAKADVDRATMKVAENRLRKVENAHLHTERLMRTEVDKLQELTQKSPKASNETKNDAQELSKVVAATIHQTKEKKVTDVKRNGDVPKAQDVQAPEKKLNSTIEIKKVMDDTALQALKDLSKIIESDKMKAELDTIINQFKQSKKLAADSAKEAKQVQSGAATENLRKELQADMAVDRDAQRMIDHLEKMFSHSLETDSRVKNLINVIRKALRGSAQQSLDEKAALDELENKPQSPIAEPSDEHMKENIHVDSLLINQELKILDRVGRTKDEKVQEETKKLVGFVKEEVKLHGKEKAGEKHEEIGERLMKSARAAEKGLAMKMEKFVKKLRKLAKKLKDKKAQKAAKNLYQILEADLFVTHAQLLLMNAKDGRMSTRQFLKNLHASGSGSDYKNKNELTTVVCTYVLPHC